jgi:phosphoadenosine phosphosulfate reductase
MAETKAYTEAELARLSAELEDKSPQEILRWAVGEFGSGLTLACSFGGPSGMVLLDMLMQIDPSVEVFYLDTDFLFPETYHLRDVCAQKYGINPVGYKSQLTPEAQAAQHGDALWSRDPDRCCEIRKVEPNYRALDGKRAWLAGMRRDQAKTRANIGIVEWDTKFGLVKINPLANWDEKQVWAYIVANGVPYNELHDHSYPSIGCTYCTKPVAKGADPRSGRWQGFDKEECGIQEGSVAILEAEGKL